MTTSDTETAVLSLLRQAQGAALDPAQPISTSLRLCLLAGKKLGSAEIEDWARLELNGYPSPTDLPAYRKLPASLQMNYVMGVTRHTQVPLGEEHIGAEASGLFAKAPILGPISEIEGHIRNAKEGGLFITPPAANSVRSLIIDNVRKSGQDTEFLNVTDIYWWLPCAAIEAILDRIRTKIVELTEELGVAVVAPTGDPKKTAEQVLTVTAGDRSPVTINTAGNSATATQKVTPSAPPQPRFWEKAWWTLGKAIAGSVMLALTAATTYFAYLAT